MAVSASSRTTESKLCCRGSRTVLTGQSYGATTEACSSTYTRRYARIGATIVWPHSREKLKMTSENEESENSKIPTPSYDGLLPISNLSVTEEHSLGGVKTTTSVTVTISNIDFSQKIARCVL